MSVDEAPLEVIQVMKQAWSEEPDRRPTFEDIFKQVKVQSAPPYLSFYTKGITLDMTFLLPFFSTVQEHHKGKEDQHHRLYAAHVGAVLLQPGGSDQREDRGAGGGETKDRQSSGSDVAQVTVQQHSTTHTRRDKTQSPSVEQHNVCRHVEQCYNGDVKPKRGSLASAPFNPSGRESLRGQRRLQVSIAEAVRDSAISSAGWFLSDMQTSASRTDQ